MPNSKRVRLIHWKAEETPPLIKKLEDAGYQVHYEELDGDNYRRFRLDPPDAFVIDLNRLPSHGREVGLYLRQTKATREIPIVFAGGSPEKIARVKQTLPDAIYSTWGRIRSSLKRAVTRPVQNPRVPTSMLEGYSGTPLPKKLGIKTDSTLSLINAPKNFRQTLGELPANVKIKTTARGPRDLTIWFVSRMKDLEQRIDGMAGAVGQGQGLWIAWPKQASGQSTDVTQTDVRKIGLASGLVDYKICSIDAIWSGLKFSRRK